MKNENNFDVLRMNEEHSAFLLTSLFFVYIMVTPLVLQF